MKTTAIPFSTWFIKVKRLPALVYSVTSTQVNLLLQMEDLSNIRAYDMQFSIKSYEFKAPDDTKSVRRYLASGAIKGIGEKMAERIVKEFGDDTFRIMEEEPERLAEIKGISLTKAMDIAAQLVDKRDMRKAMMFLQDYGISMGIAGKIYSRYGQEIYTIIKAESLQTCRRY